MIPGPSCLLRFIYICFARRFWLICLLALLCFGLLCGQQGAKSPILIAHKPRLRSAHQNRPQTNNDSIQRKPAQVSGSRSRSQSQSQTKIREEKRRQENKIEYKRRDETTRSQPDRFIYLRQIRVGQISEAFAVLHVIQQL